MKMIAYMFLGIVILSVILAPATELLCLFGDICRINSALVSSSRAAILISAEDIYAQDAEAAINAKEFEKLFKNSFCNGLGLEEDISDPNLLKSKREETFNDFTVRFVPETLKDDSGSQVLGPEGNAVTIGCSIEVTTEYKFKTNIMRKYVESIYSAKTPIRLSRHQTLKLDF